jgi:Group II intron, maturase-specific domain
MTPTQNPVARAACLSRGAWKSGTPGSEGAGTQRCVPATRRFHHQKVESWRHRGRFYLQRWPSQPAMGVLRDKIRAATDRRQVGRSVSGVVADLNPVLQGWAAYFRNGNSAGKFSTIDSYVHERLAIFDNRKRGIPGRRWGKRHDGAWFTRLGAFRLSGNVRRVAVHASR